MFLKNIKIKKTPAQASSTCRGKRRHVAHALCLPGELQWMDFGLPAGCELGEKQPARCNLGRQIGLAASFLILYFSKIFFT